MNYENFQAASDLKSQIEECDSNILELSKISQVSTIHFDMSMNIKAAIDSDCFLDSGAAQKRHNEYVTNEIAFLKKDRQVLIGRMSQL